MTFKTYAEAATLFSTRFNAKHVGIYILVFVSTAKLTVKLVTVGFHNIVGKIVFIGALVCTQEIFVTPPRRHGPDYPLVAVIVGDMAVQTVLLL